MWCVLDKTWTTQEKNMIFYKLHKGKPFKIRKLVSLYISSTFVMTRFKLLDLFFGHLCEKNPREWNWLICVINCILYMVNIVYYQVKVSNGVIYQLFVGIFSEYEQKNAKMLIFKWQNNLFFQLCCAQMIKLSWVWHRNTPTSIVFTLFLWFNISFKYLSIMWYKKTRC